jgi:NAD-dependent dihydropyrimidine dehydrogenase PreA subunit
MQVMAMPKAEGAKPSKCIACGICAKACPMGILSVEEK